MKADVTGRTGRFETNGTLHLESEEDVTFAIRCNIRRQLAAAQDPVVIACTDSDSAGAFKGQTFVMHEIGTAIRVTSTSDWIGAVAVGQPRPNATGERLRTEISFDAHPRGVQARDDCVVGYIYVETVCARPEALAIRVVCELQTSIDIQPSVVRIPVGLAAARRVVRLSAAGKPIRTVEIGHVPAGVAASVLADIGQPEDAAVSVELVGLGVPVCGVATVRVDGIDVRVPVTSCANE